jgi:NitT/TauT family transport system substrate-binding protein
MQKDGASGTPVDVQFLGFPDTITALGNKKLDAGLVVEPLVTEATSKGIARVLHTGGEIMPGSHFSVLAYSAQFATEQPDMATRFMIGYLKGVRDQFDAFFSMHSFSIRTATRQSTSQFNAWA